jgi:NAD(P)-dependent dehydrogenase (short-subunit alcohol dehydrogenase family)
VPRVARAPACRNHEQYPQNVQLANFPSLKGKRVFITGGGTGIGAAIVEAFAQQGAHVAFVDIATEASEALCEVAAAGYPEPLFRHCDLRDIPAFQNTIAELQAQLGDFDVLVNNAANDERHKLEGDAGLLERPHRHQPAPVLLRRAIGGGRHEAPWRRFHHQLQFDQLAPVQWRLPGLHHSQGLDPGPHAWPGARPRSAQDPRQYRHTGLGHDRAPDPAVAGRRGKKSIARNQCLQGDLLPWHLARMVLFLAADDSAMCTAQEFIVDAGWV